jgi:hypothetical protein
VTAVVVGSGALLGGMDRWHLPTFIEGRGLKTQPRGGDSDLPIPAACRLPLQDQTSDHLAPIRAFAHCTLPPAWSPLPPHVRVPAFSSGLISLRELLNRSGTAQRQR